MHSPVIARITRFIKLKQLEEKINEGNFRPQSSNSENINEKKPKSEVKNVGKVAIEQVSNLKFDKLDFWPKVIDKLKEDRKMLLASNLLNTIATSINDMTVGIVFQNGLTPFVKDIMEKPENIQELTRLVSIECGKEMKIKILDNTEAKLLLQRKNEKKPEDEMAKEIDIPVNIVD